MKKVFYVFAIVLATVFTGCTSTPEAPVEVVVDSIVTVVDSTVTLMTADTVGIVEVPKK